MATIKRADLVQSVADALQFISYYHPADYIRALGRAYERERSPANLLQAQRDYFGAHTFERTDAPRSRRRARAARR